ncbi:hypothetical protein MSAN_02287900 [Mycena sanguinolenta]|uniref:Uncharacterized protein n=1 Tax=Mycena sanguinolenta TaxID=230812 RepID=A0A8H6X8S4_9AGAR|nr:hypothetical protein MSAN_02287900 [Mycena sanguinolenta]
MLQKAFSLSVFAAVGQLGRGLAPWLGTISSPLLLDGTERERGVAGGMAAFQDHEEVARMLCHSDVGRVFCGIHGCANVVPPRRRLLPLRLRCHCEERMTRIIRTARQRRRRTGRRCSVEASDPVREERRSSSMTREKDLATRIAICTCRRLAGSSGMCAGLGLVTPLGYTSEFPRFSSPLPRFSSLPPILSAFSPFRRFFDIDHPLSPFAFAFRHPFPPPSPLTSLSIFSASAPAFFPPLRPSHELHIRPPSDLRQKFPFLETFRFPQASN